MTAALFVPCYVDQLAPGVAVATLRVLEALGVEVAYPEGQTCCGQPVANAGLERAGRSAAARYARAFAGYAHVVTPSGSCAAHVRHHHGDLALGRDRAASRAAADRTVELAAFLHDEVGLDRLRALGLRLAEPLTAALHVGCHALRGLGLAAPSELQVAPFDKVRAVLGTVDGLTVRLADRPDECCGFGGTFAVAEPELSAKIGRDRLAGLVGARGGAGRGGVGAVVSTDVSCTMHLEGVARRAERSGAAPVRFLHVAEALALGLDGATPPVPVAASHAARP